MVIEDLIKTKQLKDIDLGGQTLESVNFSGCTLVNVNFKDAILRHCSFEEATLENCDSVSFSATKSEINSKSLY